MNVSGVLVRTRPERLDDVRARAVQLPGVEVHAADPRGRLVLTVEDDDATRLSQTLVALQNIEGVLVSSTVYQYCGD